MKNYYKTFLWCYSNSLDCAKNFWKGKDGAKNYVFVLLNYISFSNCLCILYLYSCIDIFINNTCNANNNINIITINIFTTISFLDNLKL